MKNNNCGKCVGKWVFAAIPVFIYLFAADFLVHGIWLKPLYEQTASLWRTEEQIQQYAVWCFAFHGLLAIIITALYRKCSKNCAANEADGRKPCSIKGGICFGVVVGMFIGVLHSFSYVYMPISAELAVKWFAAGMVDGVGSGVILSFIFSRCTKTRCNA